MTIKDIAKVCHEINKAYCESIGDDSQPLWENAPQWQKDSAIQGVIFHINNPNAKPSDSHNNWLEQKIKDGWEWGNIKDSDKKTHPCILPYEMLPIEQKGKDFILLQVVHSFKQFLNKY